MSDLETKKELKKQMVHAPYTVLDPSNLTSRVTRFIANLRKLEVNTKSKLIELHKAG